MFGGDLGSQSVVTIILLILPGLASLKIYLRLIKKSDRFNRISSITYSFALTFGGALGMYAGYSISQGKMIERNQLERVLYNLPSLIIHYFVIFCLVVAVGALVGGAIRYNNAPIRSQYRLWEYYFNNVDKDEFQLRVVTSDGTKLEGRIDKYGESIAKRDIVLKKPRTVKVDDDGEVETVEEWTGSAYIHNQDISYVKIDELPDAEEAMAKESDPDAEYTEGREELLELANEYQSLQNQPKNEKNSFFRHYIRGFIHRDKMEPKEKVEEVESDEEQAQEVKDEA